MERWSRGRRGLWSHGSCGGSAWFSAPPAGSSQTACRCSPPPADSCKTHVGGGGWLNTLTLVDGTLLTLVTRPESADLHPSARTMKPLTGGIRNTVLAFMWMAHTHTHTTNTLALPEECVMPHPLKPKECDKELAASFVHFVSPWS